VGDRFFLPIDGLTVEVPWRVGTVLLHTDQTARTALAGLGDSARPHFHSLAPDNSCVAEVSADDLAGAVTEVRWVIDLVRLFLQTLAQSQTAAFGLPGDVGSQRMAYAQIGSQLGVGFSHRGHHMGATFNKASIEAWSVTEYARLSEVPAAAAVHSEGLRRARLAVAVTSRAVVEGDPALRCLMSVMATEALLGTGPRGRMLQLARRAMWFTCGELRVGDCGRARPPCAFIKLDPANDKERGELLRHKTRAEKDPAWRCSEWLDLVARYDSRSGVAHGDPRHGVEAADADRDVFWVINSLMQPALRWLMDHPTEPARAIDEALDALPPVPDDWRLSSGVGPQ